VNSAGIAVLGLIENVPLKSYSDNLQLNFFAPLSLIKSVLPGMKQKKSGQIINLFSGVGKRGLPGVSSYCVSKFALNGLTESLRVEVSPYNIDVILISPGLVQTRFANNCKIYGPLKETFTHGKAVKSEFVAEKIVEASIKKKREVVLSAKTLFGIHANYWFPSILDRILAKKL
jgi:dehydrogenase/reductase SDR family member 7B